MPDPKEVALKLMDKQCGNCCHYIFRPFEERCMKHNRIIEAEDDACKDYAPRVWKSPDYE
jgi:hypothetical protein